MNTNTAKHIILVASLTFATGYYQCFGAIGDSIQENEKKMGRPIGQEISKVFPRYSYYMVVINKKFVPLNKLNKVSVPFEISTLNLVWCVNVVYVDGQSMIEQWVKYNIDLKAQNKVHKKITNDDGRSIFNVYKEKQQWDSITGKDLKMLSTELNANITGGDASKKELDPIVFLHNKPDQIYYIMCEDSILVIKKGYFGILKQRRSDVAKAEQVAKAIYEGRQPATNDVAVLRKVVATEESMLSQLQDDMEKATEEWQKDLADNNKQKAFEDTSLTWLNACNEKSNLSFAIKLLQLPIAERITKIKENDKFIKDSLTLREFTFWVNGKVLQVLNDGLLLTDVKISKVKIDDQGLPDIFTHNDVSIDHNVFLHTDTDAYVDGSDVSKLCYWYGSYSYTSILGSGIKINAFTTKKDAALRYNTTNIK